MKQLIIVVLIALSSPILGMEHVLVFYERFTERSCKKAQASASQRVKEQLKSGSDVYKGQVSEFHGKKIIRFVESYQLCEALYHSELGMVHRYSLEIQIAAD